VEMPEDMPSEVAALLDPMAVAVRSIELACIVSGRAGRILYDQFPLLS